MTHRRALVKVSTKAKQPVNPRALLQKSVSMVVCSEKTHQTYEFPTFHSLIGRRARRVYRGTVPMLPMEM
jgi:hypothetical protein